MEAVDPKGVSFVLCDVRIPDGVYGGPRYWFCNILRVLDALDEAKSRLKIGIRDDDCYRDFGKKFYDFSGGAELAFREDANRRHAYLPNGLSRIDRHMRPGAEGRLQGSRARKDMV